MEDITKAATSCDDVIKSKKSVAETEKEKNKVIIIMSCSSGCNLSLHRACGDKRGNESNRGKGETQEDESFTEAVMSYWKGRAHSLIGSPGLCQHGIMGKYDPAVNYWSDTVLVQSGNTCNHNHM